MLILTIVPSLFSLQSEKIKIISRIDTFFQLLNHFTFQKFYARKPR